MPGQLGRQPLAQVRGGQPVGAGRDRHAPERGQRARHQVRPRLLSFWAVVGGSPERLVQVSTDPDGIERRPARHELIAKPEHWRHR
jgi:hypothetical protein